MTAPVERLAASLSGRYRIERELGQGGMATVYLAEDLKHGRKVAIKVLHPELSAIIGGDRFLSEIKLTASLQHPHILGLIDSGAVSLSADSLPTADSRLSTDLLYYVMPFIEGETLRARLTREKQLPVDDAIRLSKEVASALEFAHKRGIVHRDIKPENILLQDGQALVADFGIALAVSTPDDHRVTSIGTSVGSPVYMSPEQATAEREIDRRSDIYSLGVVVYEMLVGEPPYDGASIRAITARKLSEPVPRMRTVREGITDSVEHAVTRALARVPADRYQSCAEFVVALDQAHGAPQRAPPGATGTWRPRLPLIVGAVVLLIGAAALALRRPLPANVQIGKRTIVSASPDPEWAPSLSPDGKLVAFSATIGATKGLFVQQLGGETPIPVATQLDNARFGVFSPDGDRLLVLATGGRFIVPALGGQAKLVVPARDPGTPSWGTWSPDGSRIAFVLDDTLFTQRGDSARIALAHGLDLHSPAWSPDGRWIAYVSGNSATYTGNVAPSALHMVSASGGGERTLTDSSALNTSPAWLPGARALLFISNRDGGRDVYQLPLRRSGTPAGPPIRITTGLDAGSITISADGRRLAWSVLTQTANIWSLPIPDRDSLPMSSARQETSGRQLIENLSVSPDARWLGYDSDRSGNQDLWRIPLAGGPAERITDDPADDFQPAVSPDGREVAFHSMRNGNRDIFVMPFGGGTATRISTDPGEDADVAWSPDGRALIWESTGRNPGSWIARRGGNGVWSAPERLPFGPGRSLGWSPDGRWIAFTDSGGTALWSPVNGERRSLAAGVYMQFYEWARDGHALLGSAVMADGENTKGERRWAIVELTLDGKYRVLVYPDASSGEKTAGGFTMSHGRMYFVRKQTDSDIWVADILTR